MPNRTPKQKFQFEREYSLKGQLTAIQGTLWRVRKHIPLTYNEKCEISVMETSVGRLLKRLEENTQTLKEDRFGK